MKSAQFYLLAFFVLFFGSGGLVLDFLGRGLRAAMGKSRSNASHAPSSANRSTREPTEFGSAESRREKQEAAQLCSDSSASDSDEGNDEQDRKGAVGKVLASDASAMSICSVCECECSDLINYKTICVCRPYCNPAVRAFHRIAGGKQCSSRKEVDNLFVADLPSWIGRVRVLSKRPGLNLTGRTSGRHNVKQTITKDHTSVFRGVVASGFRIRICLLSSTKK